ncbi:ABC transporter permease [Streptomyces sp. NEAU-S7GS2]|uniref:ABC transporter permease n=1 Tax=Streptomyces sp. NEAU-S7GS2 TaxID=2202000 RepID=UPI000D6F3D04|nr:ABC transporter permease [Streptomyces sp. NEAU-S7GS2]AWN25305.1 ABC transporter permease [Streptomyces sp. NEAU-S7GS2]
MSLASGSSTRRRTPEELKAPEGLTAAEDLTTTEDLTTSEGLATTEELTTPEELSAPATGTSSASTEESAAVLPAALSRTRLPRPPALPRILRAALTGATKSAAIVALLLVWELAPRFGLVDRTFLPPFSEVAQAWWELVANGQLADNARASLVRSFSGFGIAVAVSVPLGLLIGWYRPVADLLNPLLQVFLNTAALALLPVFVLLLGIGETSKISIVVYACAWPILFNTISAVRTVDPTLLRLAKSMDLSAPRLFQKVILPASVPTIFTGIRLAGAVSIVVLVAAEMIGAKAGLGYLINASQYNFAIPQMYAGIVTISVIGVAFNQLLVAVEKRLSSWHVPATS